MVGEHFEQRLFRVFQEAGYLPSDLLTISQRRWWRFRGSLSPTFGPF